MLGELIVVCEHVNHAFALNREIEGKQEKIRRENENSAFTKRVIA
jgi:hypothetical protein